MAIKVKVGDVTQVIPNAKEVRDKILALRPSVPVTSVGGQTGDIGSKVTIFTDAEDVPIMFATGSTSNVIFGFSVFSPDNHFAPATQLKDYFIVRAWTGSTVQGSAGATNQTILGERHIRCVHNDSGVPRFRTDQTASNRLGITGISLLQL